MTNTKRKQFQEFKKKNLGKFYFFENFNLSNPFRKSLGDRLRDAMARKGNSQLKVLLHFKKNHLNVYYLNQNKRYKFADYNNFYRKIVDEIVLQEKKPIQIEQLLTLPTKESRELIKELLAPHSHKFIRISSK